MTPVFFSFLMCVNKDVPFLDKALEGMINQNYEDDYEIVIVANNCDEMLWEKLGRYSRNVKRIRLFRTEIGQLAFNLNYGVNLAKGEYIVRMDADDVCFTNRLSKTKEFLVLHGYPDVMGGGVEIIDESDNIVSSKSRPVSEKKLRIKLPFGSPIVHPSSAIRRQAIIDVRGYLGGLHCEDYDLWLRLDRSGARMLVADFMAIQYRVNEHQVSGSKVAYADGVGLRVREALVRFSIIYSLAASYSLLKFFCFSVFKKLK